MGTWGAAVGISPQAWAGGSPMPAPLPWPCTSSWASLPKSPRDPCTSQARVKA